MKYLPPELWDLIFVNLVPEAGIKYISTQLINGYPDLVCHGDGAGSDDVVRAMRLLAYTPDLLWKDSHTDYWRALIFNAPSGLYDRSTETLEERDIQANRNAKARTIVVLADEMEGPYAICGEKADVMGLQSALDSLVTMTWRIPGLQKVHFYVDVQSYRSRVGHEPRVGEWKDNETFIGFFRQILMSNYDYLPHEGYPRHVLFKKWREEVERCGIEVRVLVRSFGFLFSNPGDIPDTVEDVTMLWDDLDPLEGTTLYNQEDQNEYMRLAIYRAHGQYMKRIRPIAAESK